MQLHLKRDEKRAGLGRREYELFAQLELTPEEKERVKKADTKHMYVWEEELINDYKATVKYRIIGLILSIGLGVGFFGITMNPIIALIVALVAWLPLSKFLYNQTRQGISVADLLTGRTIHCKSMEELYVKENSIREKLQNFHNYISGIRPTTGEGETVTFN